MRVLAVDWSGAVAHGGRPGIRVAEARPGRLLHVRGDRDRAGVGDLLRELAAGPEPAVVGLDFSFGLPGWFAREQGAATLPALWRVVAERGEGWLRNCPPPFWGRTGTRKPAPDPERPLWRETELGSGARSTFQIGGAGAVGTGSIRGMALLEAWRAAGIGVWPLDGAPAGPGVTLLEIYPREFTGPVVKSDPGQRRRVVLADARIPDALRPAVASTEDAFDAALTALGMADHVEELAASVPRTDPVSVGEGRIWRPAALTAGPRPR